ncbi:MAG: hypothetical protein LAQ69_10680 [Acidobacteriia bacterium]|nr:hypothetical protein [Terriglobia bacterium]
MRLRALLWSSCISVAMAVSAQPAAAAVTHECVAGRPTAASYTWNFQGEANTIFKEVQSDAQEALYRADRLQSFTGTPELSWQTYGYQLNRLRGDINDIGAKLCRLETIRRAVAPWQQRVIDRIAVTTRLMADNAQDAIVFGNTHSKELWLATYRNYLNNLYNEGKSLTRSVGNAVEYSSVSKEYRDLRQSLGA